MVIIMISKLLAFVAVFAVVNAHCPKHTVQVFTYTGGNANNLKGIVQRLQSELGGMNNGNNPEPLQNGQCSVALLFWWFDFLFIVPWILSTVVRSLI